MTAPTNEETEKLKRLLAFGFWLNSNPDRNTFEVARSDLSGLLAAAGEAAHLRSELERVTGERDEAQSDLRQRAEDFAKALSVQHDACERFRDRAESAERARDAAIAERDEARRDFAALRKMFDENPNALWSRLDAALASAENARKEALEEAEKATVAIADKWSSMADEDADGFDNYAFVRGGRGASEQAVAAIRALAEAKSDAAESEDRNV